MPRRWRMAGYLIGVLIAVVMLAGAGYVRSKADWRSAGWESTGLAPAPATTSEAVVQVYAARTVGWRGVFGVHTWVAVKSADAREYTVYEVIGWRLRSGGSAVVIRNR